MVKLKAIWAWAKKHKVKILAFVAAVFVLAQQMGSTLLTPEQREAIKVFLGAIL